VKSREGFPRMLPTNIMQKSCYPKIEVSFKTMIFIH
jgi:hypothetical protein